MNKDTLAINTLKINGIAAVNKANSGHPGIVLGAATMMHTLFSRHLIFDPKNPKFINRDRFILSAGHGSALLYAQLRILGLISENDLKDFRQLGSITPGHPEYGMTPGVESTTGPLGQGIAVAVGLATAETHLRSNYKEIDHYTYVLCGDGDLQEGVAMEAMSFAGKQNLSKLIIMHDSNDIQLDTPVSNVFNENLKLRMEAIGFEYILVEKNDVESIDQALKSAKLSQKPSFIEIKTVIGEGATKEGTSEVHGAPLGEDISTVVKALNWNHDLFFLPSEVTELYNDTLFKRSSEAVSNFKESEELKEFLSDNKDLQIHVNVAKNQATRVSSGEVIKFLNNNTKNWIGGSADLSGSTKALGGNGEFNQKNRKGRNILFGVREFAMGAIANGLALHSNFKPFVSTFFVFSDYMKPAMRLASIMKLPVTYIFTHDSIFVGEDGPTHEPIEHIAMLRSLPGINFIRPADENEVIGAYELAYNSKESPTAIALTRQNIISLEETSSSKIKNGNYKLIDNSSEWTLVASGSELANAVSIAKELNLNAVSISNYKGDVNWDTSKAITIEAGSTYGLSKFGSYNIGIDSFGESGEGNLVYKHFKLDRDNLKKRIKEIIE
ncbi:MAG: transketolase [Mycoplasmatales bacterium]|nr:transketolase [Mycoplasmatales bacterium]